MPKTLTSFLLVGFLMIPGVRPVQAVPIVDTTGPFGSDWIVNAGQGIAAPFQFAAPGAANLNFIQTSIHDGGSGSAGLIVGLYSDLAGLPGALLTSMSLSGSFGAAGTLSTFLPDLPTVLVANTLYWVTAEANSPFDGIFSGNSNVLNVQWAFNQPSFSSWIPTVGSDTPMLIVDADPVGAAAPEIDPKKAAAPVAMLFLSLALLGGGKKRQHAYSAASGGLR